VRQSNSERGFVRAGSESSCVSKRKLQNCHLHV
jgi:hypothetical protein